MGLDRIGTFKGKPLEWGVSVTSKKKMPQFVIRVALTKFYDQKEETWFDYTGFEAETLAYLCLYGADKKKGGEIGPTLSMDQVKKVFSWDGRSMAQLANGKYEDLEFQVRIGENTYEEAKSPYQVDWIDVHDAEPGRQLRKLDAAELKELDKQFAALAAKFATPKAAATTAKTKHAMTNLTTPKGSTHPARVPADEVVKDSPEEKKRKLAAKSAKNKVAAEAAKAEKEAETSVPPPKPESKDAVVPPPKPEKTECTEGEAWIAVKELRDPTISDGTIAEVWHNTIAEIAGPDVEPKDVTPEQWYQIKEAVLNDVAKF